MSHVAGKLEWRIAWRHLRVGERAPAWAGLVLGVGIFLAIVGTGLFLYGASLGSSAEQLGAGALIFGIDLKGYQHLLAQFGLATAAAGVLAVLYAILSLFFNLLSTIITMSVLLGCMALVVALSVMSGTEQHLRRRILDQKGEVLVSSRDGRAFGDFAAVVAAIESLPMVTGASPYLKGEVLAVNGSMRQTAVLLGIEPERLRAVSTLPDIVESGSFAALTDPASVSVNDNQPNGPRDLPWRLRHLKSLKRAAEDPPPADGKANGAADMPAIQLPSPSVQLELDGDDEPFDEASTVEAPKKAPIADELPELSPSQPKNSPNPQDPSPEAAPKPGAIDDEGEGWEDPVHELGLAKPLPPTEPRALRPSKAVKPPVLAPTTKDTRDDQDDDEAWEDPVQELGLSGEAPDTVAALPAPNEANLNPSTAAPTKAAVHDAVIMGRELAKELGVQVGGLIRFVTPEGRLTPSGRMPGIKEVRVGGIYYSGMYQYDKTHVYAPLSVIQTFLRKPGRISGIEVRLRDSDELEPAKAAIVAMLTDLGRVDHLKVETWQDLNRSLFAAMFLEKIALFVALLFVVLVASFGILTSTLMSVLEKSKEIAILKAMGATDAQVRRVFVLEGLCLGMLGALGGLIAGLAGCWFLDTVGLPLQENSLYIDELPVLVDPREVALVGFAALALVLLVTIYPARVASRVRPVDALRMGEG